MSKPQSNPHRTRAIRMRARELRHDQTLAEKRLWQAIRNRQLGHKFRRQHAVGRVIVDFCCIACQLVIEIDGDIHDRQQEHDAIRTEYLQALGWRVIRFRNEDVLSNIEAVLNAIAIACGQE